jgi:uracil-DNA glycosylase
MIDDLMLQSQEVVRTLASDRVLESYVDSELQLPRPFLGSGVIHLVIIGQDPTVENEKTRKKVTTALMLNGKGHLARFLSGVCESLVLSLKNVYATNACKNFFKQRPAQIKTKSGIGVIGLSNARWLPLLQEELAWFPNAAVLTLGEPVLRSLVLPGCSQEVKTYWGHRQGWTSKGFEVAVHCLKSGCKA